MHLVHQESGRQIAIGEALLAIDKEWLALMGKRCKGVQHEHAVIIKQGDRRILQALTGDTYLNGTLVGQGQKVMLEHDSVLCFGDRKRGAFLIYKDWEQKKRRLDTQKLQAARVDLQSLKSTAEQLIRQLFDHAPTALVPFTEYFLDFLFKKFRIHRGVIYEVQDKRWIPIRARALSSKFVPPRKILSQVWEERIPVRFELNEAQETGDISRSIVDNNVNSAICFPLLRKGELVGVLYVDTQRREVLLSREDLVVLCTIMPAVGAYLYLLLSHERRRVSAAETISSFCRPSDLGPNMACEYINRDLSSFSFARLGRDGSAFFFYVGIENRNKAETDFTLQVAAYCGMFALLDTYKVYAGELDAILTMLQDYLTGRFPTLRFSVGIVRIMSNMLVYTGFGRTYLVIKPPKRNSFQACGEDAYYLDTEEEGRQPVYAMDYALVANTYFVLSAESGDKLCKTFDRITNLERVKEDIRGLSGGLFVHVGEIEDEGT